MKNSIIDLHQDLMLYQNNPAIFSDAVSQTSFEQLVKMNVKITVATAFPNPPNENYFDPINNTLIEQDFQSYIDYCDSNEQWMIIKTREDVERVMSTDGLFGIILHIEGLNVFEGTDKDWQRLDRWYRMGWRSLGIVWNLTNSLGGGTKDSKTGLTELGREVIEWCRERGMIVDFAHMNQPTFSDVQKYIDKPVWVSHGNAQALCEDPRNYSDEQLAQVKASKGIIGPFFSKKFVCKKETLSIEDLVAQFVYLRLRVGIDSLGLGTDFGGILSGFPEGLESIDQLDELWKALRFSGFTEEELVLIQQGNAQRLLRSTLPSVDRKNGSMAD